MNIIRHEKYNNFLFKNQYSLNVFFLFFPIFYSSIGSYEITQQRNLLIVIKTPLNINSFI